MEENKIQNNSKPAVNPIRQKAYMYFLVAGLMFIVFTIFCFLYIYLYDNPQKAVITSGLVVVSYFLLNGLYFLHIEKKRDYEIEIYTCSAIEKSGYRRQNRKIIFINKYTKEPFIYHTSKNLEFIEGMDYEIYFKKSGHKTSGNVLTTRLLEKQENFLTFKKDKK